MIWVREDPAIGRWEGDRYDVLIEGVYMYAVQGHHVFGHFRGDRMYDGQAGGMVSVDGYFVFDCTSGELSKFSEKSKWRSKLTQNQLLPSSIQPADDQRP